MVMLKTIWSERKKIADGRLDICNTCEHLDTSSMICKKCYCLVDIKTFFLSSECPVGKWKQINSFDIETNTKSE